MASLISSTSQSNFKTVIDTLLADINAVVPNFSSLVSSYRLLVGSAEEIHRTPGVSPDIVVRAIERYDRTGVLIDIIIDLLFCKVSFISDLLSVTGGPIDLIRLLSNRIDVADTPNQVAEDVILLEVLRRAQECLNHKSDTEAAHPPGPPPITFATSLYQPPFPPASFPPQEPLPEFFQPVVAEAPPPTVTSTAKHSDTSPSAPQNQSPKPTNTRHDQTCRPRKLR
ncbi:MAG: hypothetical protein H6Q74_2393 [Firmicutes bacterium]|nr:hypothetical protein [Bacillota bacterium]